MSNPQMKTDAYKEFFSMCLISYKMNDTNGPETHLKMNDFDFQFAAELDQEQLYKKCTEVDNCQFYQFHDWIEKEVKKLKFRHLFRENLKK